MSNLKRTGTPMVLAIVSLVISCTSLFVNIQNHYRYEALNRQFQASMEASRISPEKEKSYHPPSYKRINPMPPGAPYDDPKPLKCSRITFTGPGINSTVTYTVPAGWSVWMCLKERFPDWDDHELMESVNILKFYMNDDKQSKYTDPNKIPADYQMVGGLDGAGPGPLM